jgi:hypothetical protein
MILVVKKKAPARPLVKSEQQWLAELNEFSNKMEACDQKAAAIFRALRFPEDEITDLCRQVPYGQFEFQWWRPEFTEMCVSLAKARHQPEKPAKKPVLTEPLTKTELGEYFTCHRNNVEKLVLDKYPHETVGKGRGPKYRLHVADMPPAYQQKHLKPKP